MRYLAIIMGVLSGCFLGHLNAQMIPTDYDTLIRSQEVIVSGGVDYAGSSMQNDITSKFLFGGGITSEVKDRIFDKHTEINRFGGFLNGDIEYRNYNVKLFKKKDWGFLIKGGYATFGGALYSKDAFGLGMYGNERYIGDTMNLSGMDVSLTSYQKIGFGLIDRTSKSNVTFNIYNISRRYSLDARDLMIGQDSAGDTVTLTVDGSMSLPSNLKFNQGVGFGVDLDFKIPFKWGNDQEAFMQFQMQNIGVGFLYEEQKTYALDTTIVYTGLEFSDIVGGGILADSLDVLDTLGVSSTLGTKAVLLPGYIQIGKIVDQHNPKMVQSFFGIRLFPTLIYAPYAYAGVNVRAIDWLNVGVSASYGGFANLRAGVYASASFKKIAIGLSTENLIGLISKRGSGKSLYLRVRCAF
ncbi:MAG: hypothetical protein MK066_06065 [Crocinitomicaceae bacterium]|nr:hypothetical protein [Crocinitomicaceae bacterium]